ncbi:MAG: aldo/keto reductase [Gammaproteobacteria bacterium]
MKTVSLVTGDTIPVIGLGTWQASEAVIQQAIHVALDGGYRHIDCAPIYLNEPAIGRALQRYLARENVTIKRENLWITSKLWNSFHAPEQVEPALKQTLHDLQLEYLDLYLIHWPVAFKAAVGLDRPQRGEDYVALEQIPLTATWQALEALVDKGLVKNIGVSNFSISKLKTILAIAKHQPAVNQVESHPYLPQTELLTFCQQHNIVMTAYSPLGSGGRDAAFKKPDEPSVLNDTTIHAIAKSHAVTPAQVLLAWQIARGVVVIPKSVHPERIQQNLAAIKVKLTKDDMEQIDYIDQEIRYIDGSFWETAGSPYTAQGIWQ